MFSMQKSISASRCMKIQATYSFNQINTTSTEMPIERIKYFMESIRISITENIIVIIQEPEN